MAWDKEAADAAKTEAQKELKELVEKGEIDQQSMIRLHEWWAKYLNGTVEHHATGHKRLAQAFYYTDWQSI